MMTNALADGWQLKRLDPLAVFSFFFSQGGPARFDRAQFWAQERALAASGAEKVKSTAQPV